MWNNVTKSLLAVVAVGLFASACGSSTDDNSSAAGTEPEPPTTTVAAAAPTTTAPTTTAPTTTVAVTSTTVPPTTTVPAQPGVLTMEFGEWLLTYPIDDCPVDSLANGGFWALPDAPTGVDRVPAENIDGTTWEIEVVASPGPTLDAIAAAPGDKPFYIGNSAKVEVEVEFTDVSATYSTTFVNAVFDGPDELAAVVTITCDA